MAVVVVVPVCVCVCVSVVLVQALCEKWTLRLMEEFFAEGDREGQLGLEVGALNDREKVIIPKAQVGFINFIALPLWEAWSEYISPDTETVQVHNIIANRYGLFSN